jgi:hypothetical protein
MKIDYLFQDTRQLGQQASALKQERQGEGLKCSLIQMI